MPVALVTGYSGFLGQELLAQMSAAGWRFLLAGRTPPYNRTDSDFLSIDFECSAETAFPARMPAPEVVIHLASRVAMSSDSDKALFAPNVLSTAIMANWAARWGCPVILASSVSVYAPDLETITPDESLQPAGAYGRSKLLAERVLTGSGVENCILRIAGIYGANGPNHLGINTAIKAARVGRRPVLRGGGHGLRNYVYLKDAAAAFAQAASSRLHGMHLVAGPDTLSIADMLRRVCDQWLPGTSPEHIDGPPGRDSVVEARFPFAPRYRFEAGLRDIAESA